MSADNSVEEVLRVIGDLPQAAHIAPDTAKAWMKAVFEREPERARWHAMRARGIGGSEMGAVLAAMRGEYHPFTPGDKVARQKLLLDPPEEPTGDTKRGTYLEDPLRDLYRPIMLAEHGARPAEDVLDAIREIDVSASRRNPWQVGNPDDAFWLPNGALIMADYKAPRPDVLKGYEVFGKPMDYIVQLHHYTMLAIEKGYTPSKLILVSLDINGWKPVAQEIPFQRELCEQIEKAGARFWNDYVLKGIVPEPVNRPVGEAGAMPADVVAHIRRTGRILALANTAYREARNCNEELSAVVGNKFLMGKPAVKLDHIEVLAKAQVDEGRVKRIFELWGEKIDNYRLPSVPNVAKMEQKLKELGVDAREFYEPGELDGYAISERLRKGREDPSRYVHEAIEVKLTPLRRGDEAEMLFTVREEAEEVIKEFSARPDPTLQDVKERIARKQAERAASRGARSRGFRNL